MDPYTTLLWKRIRALPLGEIQDLMRRLKYVEVWIDSNEASQIVPPTDATRAEARCIGHSLSCVAQVRKTPSLWEVFCEGARIGSSPDLATAKDMADTELELKGYILPWRRGV